MEMNFNCNTIQNSYNTNSSGIPCKNCGRPTIITGGLCPSCCNEKYSTKNTNFKRYNSKELKDIIKYKTYTN